MISAVLYWLNDLISIRFKENTVFMLTSGSHKMLKILIEILVQIFRDNIFSAFFPFSTLSV